MNNLYQTLLSKIHTLSPNPCGDEHTEHLTIGVVGCGYVGKALICAFAFKPCRIICLDIDERALMSIPSFSNTIKTTEPVNLIECDVIFICVPTLTTPTLSPHAENQPIGDATRAVTNNMKKGTLVIIESSVAIGDTRKSAKYIEAMNDWACGEEFFMGFSPERINPGDDKHTFENTLKLAAGIDGNSSVLMYDLYRQICDDVMQALTPEQVEAAKLVENTQRVVNIAYMNEIKTFLEYQKIDAEAVFKLCRTKWNWADFKPGLVGGDCLPNNPFYLFDSTQGHWGEISIRAARINEYMYELVVNTLCDKLDDYVGKRVLVIGTSYKDGVSDEKGSQMIKIVKELRGRKLIVDVCSDSANVAENMYDAVIVGYMGVTAKKRFEELDIDAYYKLGLKAKQRVLIDFTGKANYATSPFKYDYWRLG